MIAHPQVSLFPSLTGRPPQRDLHRRPPQETSTGRPPQGDLYRETSTGRTPQGDLHRETSTGIKPSKVLQKLMSAAHGITSLQQNATFM